MAVIYDAPTTCRQLIRYCTHIPPNLHHNPESWVLMTSLREKKTKPQKK